VVAIIVPWTPPLALLIRSLAPRARGWQHVVIKMPRPDRVGRRVANVIAQTPALPTRG